MYIRNLVVLLMITVMLMPSTALGSGVVAGEDVSPSEDEVPFSISKRTSPSVDGQSWMLTVVMDDDVYENGTSFEITTQVCTNNGVCDPPVLMEASIDDKVYSVSVKPPSNHTYVNWRVKAIYSDDSYTNYPNGDWFKTWSSCYYQQDTGWDGIDFKDGECDISSDNAMPGFGFAVAATSLVMATVLIRRD
tara:strand:- start:108 stop:680 length:573 start_codon:yes stop_codon:yes gene_type:complete